MNETAARFFALPINNALIMVFYLSMYIREFAALDDVGRGWTFVDTC